MGLLLAGNYLLSLGGYCPALTEIDGAETYFRGLSRTLEHLPHPLSMKSSGFSCRRIRGIARYSSSGMVVAQHWLCILCATLEKGPQ